MKEIEIKLKVDDFQEVLQKLEDVGCSFSKPIVQDDTNYVNYDRPYIEFTPEDPFLRIRRTEGKTIFTFKRGEEMNSIEREFEVSDGEQLKDVLIFLGFKEANRIRKTRRKAKYKEYEICLDEVEGLGSFIEIEEITGEESTKVQDEMMEFLSNLGIKGERVRNGYDILLWNKDNPRNI